jgi:hypothetical protein
VPASVLTPSRVVSEPSGQTAESFASPKSSPSRRQRAGA